MGWNKPKPNGMGGYVSRRDDRGQNESIHGKTVKDRNVDQGNHVHFHKDGATITKNGKKESTLTSKRCSNCGKDTKHKVVIDGDNITNTCTRCKNTYYTFR